MIKVLEKKDGTCDLLEIKVSKTQVKFHAYVDQCGNVFRMKRKDLLLMLVES